MQRNFQGYSTHSGADLYAFGMSGISNVGDYYWQNTKDLGVYYASLDQAKLPVMKVLELNKDDKLRKEVIMQLMCKRKVAKSPLEQKWNIDFDDYFNIPLRKLESLQQDELIRLKSHSIEITERGRLFLRNIAMCFDMYLSESKPTHNFSKTV